MKGTMIVTLLLAFFAWSAAANAQIHPPKCDRECLRGTVTQLLCALVKHDVSSLPVADTLRVTEDAVEKPLAKIGLVGTVTRLRGFRQDIIDERAGLDDAPRPDQLAAREDAVKAALKYPEGLNAAKTFAAVNAPFAPDAYRYENGQVMAGPDCKFAPGCQNISTQSLAIFQRLGAHHRSKAFRRDRNPARSAEESWDR